MVFINKMSYTRAREIISEKGGIFGKIYMNYGKRKDGRGTSFITYTCQNGHINDKPLTQLIGSKSSWCYQCNITPYEKVVKYAEDREGKCLTPREEYVSGNKPPIKWMCKKGHIWHGTYNRLNTHNSWCKLCKRYSYEEILETAKNMGGECLTLEKDFISAKKTKITWKCASNHIWESFHNGVKTRGNWCKKCAGERESLRKKCTKKPINFAIKRAQEYGFKFVSDKYTNSKDSYQFQCEIGHVFSCVFDKISRTKCKECHDDTMFAEIQEYAHIRGGKCLTTREEYINTVDTKIHWCCDKGHSWYSFYGTVKHNQTWCRKCRMVTYEDLLEVARSRNGKCLTTREEFVNTYSIKITWKCHNGHIWQSKYKMVKFCGNWCTQCIETLAEKTCRAILELLYKKPFSKIRPKWLENLELDGYCEELAIAFEYNGRQHYKRINHWQPTEADFLAQQERDRRKAQICKERNILLLVIPYTVKYEDLYDYIVFTLIPVERLPSWGVYHTLDYSLLKF